MIDDDIFDSQIFLGIERIGQANTAQCHHITHRDQAGALLAGNSNVVRLNVISESAIGVLKIAGSAGNTNNTYFNSPAKLDGPTAGVPKASPYRSLP